MTWATIESFLKDHGLTETETQVYIFIAKHGVLKNREISRHLNKDRAQTLRIIKNLQNKGLVESTLEVPQRFTAIPFDKVLEAFVKEKREEANLIENTKQELLNYWKNIRQTKTEQSLTKFNVIKGNKKIYLKIAQMIKETTNQLSFITTVNDIKRATQYGIFELEPKKSPQKDIQLRFITEISDKNINTMKSLLKIAFRTSLKIKGRNPDLGSRLFPRMVIRDNAETIFFIKSKTNNQESPDLCLWTNCTELVQAFTSVFEDLWNTSTDIELKIKEIETDSHPPKTYIINDSTTAYKKHIKVLKDAQKEIIMITSTEGLNSIAQKTQLIQSWIQKNISVKIMAPITIENKQATEKLSTSTQIRHVPFDYLATTIVDEKYLLQFKNAAQTQETPIPKTNFEKVFFTTDLDYITKRKNMINEIWKNSTHPSTTTISSIFNPQADTGLLNSKKKLKESAYDKLILNLKETPEIITEKDVLNKLINAKKYLPKNWPNKPLISYGSTAHAVIHPPKKFNLPEIMIWIMHLNKQSSFGAEDLLVAYLNLKTESGHQYVPVASITDNPKTVAFRNKQFAGTPASNNIYIIKKEEFQVRVHGETFFAGWTVPIPLYPTELILPPSCLLLEGHSKLTSGLTKFRFPSGIKVIAEHNGFDAFVTYFHPASKYSGPGTDGRIHRDIVTTFYPP